MRAISVASLMLALNSSTAFAQSQVRVLKDQSTIWRRAAAIVATTVKSGTLLDVAGREGDWYVVVIPDAVFVGELGLIAASQVEIVGGGVAPPQAPRAVQPPAGQRPVAPAQTRPPSPRSPAPRPVEVFGFGALGYGSWLARDTFSAVLGSSNAPMFGGGVQVRFGGLFIEGSVERFEKTGARVFVDGGDVFNLGIADTVRIIPITATVGYRHAGRNFTPYVGGGLGTYLYKETSDFADASENLSEHFTSYHLLGGVEFASRAWVRAALEVEYTTVPRALGTSGASAAFDEHNLGGVHGRLKVMFGR
jgi:opacity protein-like surface antigen